MLVPEIQSPEFYSVLIEYPADDEVPSTSMAILRFIATNYGEPFVVGGLSFNIAMEQMSPASGTVLDETHDQPTLPAQKVDYDGSTRELGANLHAVWLCQRSQAYYQSLNKEQQASIEEMLGSKILKDLVSLPLTTRLMRVDNRFAVA